MDILLNALKCSNCGNILSKPVILPCGHTICQSHTQVRSEQIICSKCGSSHECKGDFPINKMAEDMVKAQLDSLDFGPEYNESVKSCEKLKQQLDKNEAILSDVDYFIYESIDELKKKVEHKSEKLKLRIDEITQELLDDLDNYEKYCKEKRKSKQDLVSLIDQFKELNEGAKKSCEKWKNELNELKVNDEKWKKIKEESEKALDEMCDKLNNFKKLIMNTDFESKKQLVESFENFQMDELNNLVTSIFT